MRRSFRNGLIVVGVVCLGTGSWTWLQGGEEDGTPQPTVQNSVEVAAPPFVSTPLTETGEAACSDPAALPRYGFGVGGSGAGLAGSIVLEEKPRTQPGSDNSPSTTADRARAGQFRGRTAPPQGDQIGDGAGSDEALGVALQSRMDADFDHLSIADVVASLQKQLKVTFWIDVPHVTQQLEQVATQSGGEPSITLHARNIRVTSVLNLVLAPSGLDWMVQDEVIRITTAEVASSTLETRVYAVADLLEAGMTCAQLARTITQGVGPGSWGTTTDSASIQELPQALVVRQSQRVHGEIQYLLEDLHTAHEQGPLQIGASRDAPIALKVYQLGPLGSEEMAARLQELVAPDSWETADGPGIIRSAPGGVLFVRNSLPVQEEIARILGELTGTPHN